MSQAPIRHATGRGSSPLCSIPSSFTAFTRTRDATGALQRVCNGEAVAGRTEAPGAREGPPNPSTLEGICAHGVGLDIRKAIEFCFISVAMHATMSVRKKKFVLFAWHRLLRWGKILVKSKKSKNEVKRNIKIICFLKRNIR